MKEKTQKRIFVKWVRSGIGFTYMQKGMVRSLGLSRLNQVVKAEDTPQNRGIVAKVPHLVEIVEEPKGPAWASVPEYTIYPPEPAPAQEPPAPPVAVKGKGQEPVVEVEGDEEVEVSAAVEKEKPKARAKAASKTKEKPQKPAAKVKTKAKAAAKKEAKHEKPAKKGKK